MLRAVSNVRRMCAAAGPALLVWLCPALRGAEVDFGRDIQPILKSSCLACHNTQTRSSGFSAASVEEVLAGGARFGAAIIPGHPERSPLIRLLRGEGGPQMPLGGAPLPEEQIARIADWIRAYQPTGDAGALRRPWWQGHKPVQARPPEVRETSWVRNPIDRFILAKLEENGLRPSPEASQRTLLRRAFFDLIGLPPTPEEVRAFLEDDEPDAWERLIDRLLEDPRYGERWGRHWLDLARYADTIGFEADRELPHMWRYRDYVIESFNRDKPYDRFILEQIAGDEIPGDGPEKLIATGFLRLGPVFQTTIAAQSRQMLLSEITNTVSAVFLGLTVGCAQCHDHKYDGIPQKDYYRLQAFFLPVQFDEVEAPFRPWEPAERVTEAGRVAQRRLEEKNAQLKTYEDQLLARWRAACESGGCGEQKIVRTGLKGKLLTSIANGLVPNEDPTFSLKEKEFYLDLLDYVDGRMGGRDPGMYRRQVERSKPRAHAVKNLTVSGFNPEPPAQFVRVGGEYDRLGERVEPGFLSMLTGHEKPARLPTDTFGNVRTWRVALAGWIASPDNPLTARVMANRIWQSHFGQGIVMTPSDFGRNGTASTHPDLLDWLAARFVESGWSVKAMHRLMLASATYRQSSQHGSPVAEKEDPGNRMLWRMTRRRIEGESIRDSILAVSGRLNPERGGPGVFPRLPEALDDRLKIKNFTAWETSDGPETLRRSIYIFQRRQLEVPFLTVLDAPTLQAPRDVRRVSTTPLQALTLLNGRLVNEEALHFAERVRREAGDDTASQVRRAFELALARSPAAEELADARDFLATERDGGLLGFCRILFNANEFVYVD